MKKLDLPEEKIQDLTSVLTQQLLDATPVAGERLSGKEIAKFTGNRQINHFILFQIYNDWNAHLRTVRHRYFDFDRPEVRDGLLKFSNLVSRNISIRKEDLPELLHKAVYNSMRLVVDPKGTFENFFFLNNDRLPANLMSKHAPYFIEFGFVLQSIIKYLEKQQIQWISKDLFFEKFDRVIELFEAKEEKKIIVYQAWLFKNLTGLRLDEVLADVRANPGVEQAPPAQPVQPPKTQGGRTGQAGGGGANAQRHPFVPEAPEQHPGQKQPGGGGPSQPHRSSHLPAGSIPPERGQAQPRPPANPQGRQTPPANRPANPPQQRPVNQPQRPPANPPQQRPVNQPQRPPANPPQQRPVNQPQRPPANPPQQRPVNQPQRPPANPPQQRPVNQPQRPPANPPQQRPVNQPQRPPANPPQQRPINQPQRPPANPPQQRPVNQPQRPPVNQPQRPPANPPQERPVNQPQRPPANPPQERPVNPPQRPPANPPQERPVNQPQRPPATPSRPPLYKAENPQEEEKPAERPGTLHARFSKPTQDTDKASSDTAIPTWKKALEERKAREAQNKSAPASPLTPPAAPRSATPKPPAPPEQPQQPKDEAQPAEPRRQEEKGPDTAQTAPGNPAPPASPKDTGRTLNQPAQSGEVPTWKRLMEEKQARQRNQGGQEGTEIPTWKKAMAEKEARDQDKPASAGAAEAGKIATPPKPAWQQALEKKQAEAGREDFRKTPYSFQQTEEEEEATAPADTGTPDQKSKPAEPESTDTGHMQLSSKPQEHKPQATPPVQETRTPEAEKKQEAPTTLPPATPLNTPATERLTDRLQREQDAKPTLNEKLASEQEGTTVLGQQQANVPKIEDHMPEWLKERIRHKQKPNPDEASDTPEEASENITRPLGTPGREPAAEMKRPAGPPAREPAAEPTTPTRAPAGNTPVEERTPTTSSAGNTPAEETAPTASPRRNTLAEETAPTASPRRNTPAEETAPTTPPVNEPLAKSGSISLPPQAEADSVPPPPKKEKSKPAEESDYSAPIDLFQSAGQSLFDPIAPEAPPTPEPPASREAHTPVDQPATPPGPIQPESAPAEQPTAEKNTGTLADKFRSKTAKTSQGQEAGKSLADSLGDTGSKENLASKYAQGGTIKLDQIPVHKQFQYVQKVFSGSSVKFKVVLDKINKTGSLGEAQEVLDRYVFNSAEVDRSDPVSAEFIELVRARFNA